MTSAWRLILGLTGGWAGVFAQPGVEPAVITAMRLAREGAESASAGDAAAYLQRMESAAALRPDFPRILVNLAAAQLAHGRAEDAVATLGRLADLGVHSPVEKSAEFVALRGRPEFVAVTRRLAANLHPRGKGEIAFTVREFSGLPEGIAWREKTGDVFIGDVHLRTIWRRGGDGVLQRFTAEEDNLLGVFGIVVDEAGGRLWAATAAVPAMRGFTPEQDGTSALVEIDLGTGRIQRVMTVPRRPGDRYSHVLGDLALASDGTVWLADSGAPQLWRLAPGAPGLEAWLESPEFPSLQGIVVRSTEHLLVADHANGLLRVGLSDRRIEPLAAPAGSTLVGLDGLIGLPDGRVLGVQNGTRPARIVRVELAPGDTSVVAVDVIESGHLTMPAPALGCVGPGGQVLVIGNAGWSRFSEGEPTPAPRSVPIFRVSPDAPAAGSGPAGVRGPGGR